jgi:hypothetical protein
VVKEVESMTDFSEEELRGIIQDIVDESEERRIIRAADADDNKEILNLIQERMAVGIERYGHGLRVFDDTRQWGTQNDSWLDMALEEVLDNLVYIAAQMLRIRRRMKFPDKGGSSVSEHEPDRPDDHSD